MNDPIPDELRTFQEQWFKYYTDIPENVIYFTTVDPAIAVEDINDYTAIVTCAIDQKENIYVVETIEKRMLPSETVDTIFDVYKRWRPASIGIESVGFQRMLHYDIDREKKRRAEYPVIVELKSGGRRKGLRVEALQPWFEAGRIFLKESQEELKTQLLRFPSPNYHDDLIDALAYQLDIMRPALRDVQKLNPECFLAHILRMKEKRKRSEGGPVWGNLNLRKKG
jgi:predicted phage terminase large subunit-like protein